MAPGRAQAADELAEMTAAATGVLERSPAGAAALDALGWEATDLDDADARRITAALFRAAGRTGATTPALGRLAARAALGDRAGDGWTMAAEATADGDTVAVQGPAGLPDAPAVVVDLDGGLWAGVVTAREPATTAMDEWAVVHGVTRRADLSPLTSGIDAVAGRERSDRAARFAIAHEILGSCDVAIRLAVEHVGSRVQFGSPLGRFQAVQHLLAEAEHQRRALESACAVAVRAGLPAGGDEYLKALAGRAGRAVMQGTLQAFGAIGFTEEHRHHRLARRVLAMDALWGTAATLTARIGTRAIAARHAWRSPVWS